MTKQDKQFASDEMQNACKIINKMDSDDKVDSGELFKCLSYLASVLAKLLKDV